MTSPHDYFHIYIKDHSTLLNATQRLADRHAESSEWSKTDSLAPMMQHIEREVATMDKLMQAHDLSHGLVEDALTWLGERLGRFKLNGHLVTRSPLSEVTELEALALCAQARYMFWKSLHDLPEWAKVPPECGDLSTDALTDYAQCSSLHEMALRRAMNTPEQ